MQAFPPSEQAEDLAQIDFDDAPLQRTLGVAWDVQTNTFLVGIDLPIKPFTRRGVLATVNAIFDPPGIACPVVLEGRLIQRAILTDANKTKINQTKGWDDPLPEEHRTRWEQWRRTLTSLEQLRVPRGFFPTRFGQTTRRELHVFADASEEAIGHVSYLRSVDDRKQICVSFVIGESRVAPRAATSVLCLELCVAVEAAQTAREVLQELDQRVDAVVYYSDSRVISGYMSNVKRRFSKYVTRRVEIINNLTDHAQWRYVATTDNPADMASRPHELQALLATTWLSRPAFLQRQDLKQEQPAPLAVEELPELLPAPAEATVLRPVGTRGGEYAGRGWDP